MKNTTLIILQNNELNEMDLTSNNIYVWYNKKQKLYHYSSKSLGQCFNSFEELQEELQELGHKIRQCSKCNKLMNEGYIFQNIVEYYCTDKCLMEELGISNNEEYQEKIQEYYNNNELYYTEW